MSGFTAPSDQPRDSFLSSAGQLVSAANIYAISSYTAFAKRFPAVNSISASRWDWTVTVASVFMAATRLSDLRIDESREEELMSIVVAELLGWNTTGVAGFDDCKSFFERTYDGLAESDSYRLDRRFLASDSVGSWIFWNLLDRPPSSEEERMLTRSLGIAVTHAFFDWWKVD